MSTVTGIEFGGDFCVLARVRPHRDQAQLTAIHGLSAGDWNSDRAPSDSLRAVRRAKRFPRRARVVAWGLPDGSSASSASARAALLPITEAGFSIDDVLTPPEALALLAAQRPRVPGHEATAWLALNRTGAAIAVVHADALLFGRTFAWRYRDAAAGKEQLLQRYSLLSHLALELRHAFEVVRGEHGAGIDRIVTCGDLPDLRSMTMPLIEELDIEVETLDTMDGLSAAGPLAADAIRENAPALRLVTAAALGRTSRVDGTPRRYSAWVPAAAAAALLALLVWAGSSLLRRDANGDAAMNPTAEQVEARPVPPPVAESGSGPVGAQPRLQVDQARAETAVVPAPRPAGTVGRQEPAQTAPPERGRAGQPTTVSPEAGSAVSARAARASRAEPSQRAAPPVARTPLRDPLPVVNSILVSPDRRLAVIDGSIVREGEHVGPRVLVRIESAEVVLREPSGREVRVPIRRRIGGGSGG